MSYTATYTTRIGLPYFSSGARYSAEGDRKRFFYLDYNLESYIGVLGVGIIDGWTISDAGGLKVTVGYGTAILRSFFSESPFEVKLHANVLPTDYVIQYDYYEDYLADSVPEGVYDTELGMYPPAPSGGHDYVYDKVLYAPEISLSDNADNYLYIYRNSKILQDSPYYAPDNTPPGIAETSSDANAYHTAVAFGVTGSKGYAQSSGRALIGKIVTRSGAVFSIDTSAVSTLKDLQSAILGYGETLLKSHRHGGKGKYDPAKVILRTDLRPTALETANGKDVTYRILYSDPTSVSEGHKHYFSVDGDGNGDTVTIIGSIESHYHAIDSYKVASAGSTGSSVPVHEHTIPVSATSPDTWTAVEDYQIYINDLPYYGENATVDVTDKVVSFTDDVTVVKRKYKMEKVFSDGSTYFFNGNDQFGYEFSSIYRFMLVMQNDYYRKNSEAISNGTKEEIILPDPATGITPLKDQCIVAEEQLVQAGDTFTFMGEVAPDPITVTLVEPGHVDDVKIEIVSNSEVSGKLRAQNVLYIPADKFKTGVFEVGRIPILSHLGRYLEKCEFESSRAYSYDGYVYQIDDTVPWGNGKIVYSVYVDSTGGCLIGTSDGLYSYPVDGSYLFVVNGEKIFLPYGDLTTSLKLACGDYATKTGTYIIYDDDIFAPQIELAEKELVAYDTHYKLTGSHRIVDGKVEFDVIHVFRVEGHKLPYFGYETTRLENEILEGEEVIEILKESGPSETDSDSGSSVVTLRSVRVKNDFNKSSVKKILVENNYTDQYGGLSRVYFAVASDFIARSSNVDVFWSIVYQSGMMGYISEVFRNYIGNYVAVTSSGLYVCTSVTSSEYKDAVLPSYESSLNASTFGFGQDVLIAYGTKLALSSDYGGTWSESEPTGSNVKRLMFDPYKDKTSTDSLHYHSLSIDYAGNGSTSLMYNSFGVEIESTHSHLVSSGVIAESIGHTHTPIRTFIAVDELGVISTSEDGITWSEYAEIPSTYGEVGHISACFGKLFVVTEEGLISTSNGLTWVLVSDLPYFYSSQWNEQNDIVYFGAENKLYSYDGTTFTLEKEFIGSGIPSIYVSDSRYRFGFSLNNYKRKADFLGENKTLSSVDFTYDFGLCFPIHGSWTGGISYDLYVNDSMVKSTHDGVTMLESLKADVNNSGYIDFSVHGMLENTCAYGDEVVDLVDASEFPESGDIRLSWDGEVNVETAFFHYNSKVGNWLYLDSPSQYEVATTKTTTDSSGKTTESKIEVVVDLLSSLGVDDNVLITIYEGKLKNVGVNSHYDIEDQLSIQNIGSPKSFADVYLSNLMHTTVAIKYAISEVGDDFKNYFLTVFDYNDTPGDEKNIDRFIDRSASDFFSQVMYASTFYPFFGTNINRIVFGFGDFSNVLFVATNIGLYAAKTNLGYEANWFRIDIGGETIVYDVLQAKDDLIFACTENGLYKNLNSMLTIWSKFDENIVGGTPLKINARWSGVGAYNNNDSYWWQGWQGVTHENSSLVNSLFVSGIGFAIITDDYGVTWQKSYIKGISGSDISGNYSISDMAILHDGTVLAGVKNIDSGMVSIINSTGNGGNWKSIFDFERCYGKISSYVLTDYGNVELTVSYDSLMPSGGSLAGLVVSCNSKDFLVINNSGYKIVVFGSQIVDSLHGADSFTIEPATINSVSEAPEGNIFLGTSNGICTDNGVFLASGDTSSGSVKRVGVRADVVSLNINGRIKSVVFSSASRTMIVTEIDRTVKSNELKGYKLRFDGFTDMTVVSNASSKSDKTTSFTVTCDWTNIPSGIYFVASSDNNRLYVDFDSIVIPGELKGGRLYTSSEVFDYIPNKSATTAFDVIDNGDDYIDIKEDSSNNPKADWNALFVPGATVFSTLSNKTVPLYVDFTQFPSNGALKGNYATFRNVSNNIDEIQVIIEDNTENIVYIPYEFTAQTTVVGSSNKKTETFVAYNCIFDGDRFSLKNASFKSDPSFNLQSSSVVLDHKHDVSLYGKFVEGTISSIGDNTSTYVDLNVETISDFSLPPFLGNPSLLSGQSIVMYDPENYSRTYNSHVTTATSTVIRVTVDGDFFNTSGLEPKKVSTGFRFIIDATLYGTTGAVEYTDNFVVDRGYLTDDTFIKGATFTVNSTVGMSVGDVVALKDRHGLAFRTKIQSIPSPTTFVTEDLSPFDFLVSKDSSYERLFSNIEIGDYSLIASSLLGTNIATIPDTSYMEIGDGVIFRDNRGLVFSSLVSNIMNPTTFEVADDFPADFMIVNASSAVVTRYNYEETHAHTIKAGEFSQVGNAVWNGRGYSYYHSHVVSPYVKEVYDIEVVHSKTMVAGNESKIYSSNDSGYSWGEYVDLNDVDTDPPVSVQIIASNGNDILFGAEKKIVYHSTVIRTEAVPLEEPV